MKKGFTLIEVLVVITMIFIFISIVVTNWYAFKGHDESNDVVIVEKKTAESFPEKKSVEKEVVEKAKEAYDYNQWEQESKY